MSSNGPQYLTRSQTGVKRTHAVQHQKAFGAVLRSTSKVKMPSRSRKMDLDGIFILEVASCFTFFLLFSGFSRQLAAFASWSHHTLKEAEWLGNPETVWNRLMCEISESKLPCLANTRNRAYCYCLYGQVCVFTGRLVDADLQKNFH